MSQTFKIAILLGLRECANTTLLVPDEKHA